MLKLQFHNTQYRYFSPYSYAEDYTVLCTNETINGIQIVSYWIYLRYTFTVRPRCRESVWVFLQQEHIWTSNQVQSLFLIDLDIRCLLFSGLERCYQWSALSSHTILRLDLFKYGIYLLHVIKKKTPKVLSFQRIISDTY